jgi:hypothetical protein
MCTEIENYYHGQGNGNGNGNGTQQNCKTLVG